MVDAPKDMDRWLGDGGMPLLGDVGASLDRYGVDGEDLGWVTGAFAPTELACNPHGTVQAGVHAVVLDAAMNFAINAALAGRDRTRGTLELKCETMRAARPRLGLRGARGRDEDGAPGRLRRGHAPRRRRVAREPRDRHVPALPARRR